MNEKESNDESSHIFVVCYCFSFPLSNKKHELEFKYPRKISKTEIGEIKYLRKVKILHSRNLIPLRYMCIHEATRNHQKFHLYKIHTKKLKHG